jgi:glycosyltransferase involved in cell wall biosynthesis
VKIAAVHNFLTQKRGAELAFLNKVIGLKKRGHEIDVYILGASEDFINDFERWGVDVISSNFTEWKLVGTTYIPLLNNLRALRKIKKIARGINRNYDVAFVHHHRYSPLIFPYLRIPNVYYCQEHPRLYYEPQIKTKNTFYDKLRFFYLKFMVFDKLLDKYCVNYACVILSNSDFAREQLWRTYGKLAITNYLGVNSEVYKPTNVEKDKFILSVGVLDPAKAHDFVIRSVGLLPERKRPEVLIVGDGPAKRRLFRIAAENNVKITIKKDVSTEEMVQLYNKTKLTAIAFVMEPFGLVALESMACETPVIAVREGGLREIVTDNTGILTNRDEREFATAMLYLLKNQKIAKEMGKKGRERVQKNFTWKKCAENLEKNLSIAVERFKRN